MYCILIAGLPASGKTTFSEYLSEALDLPLISKDKIKEQLYDTLGFSCREEKVRLGVAAMEIMYYVARQQMKRNKPFILENNFENISRPGLMALLEEYGYQAVTVTMTGAHSVLYQRFVRRNHSPERHRGHVVDDGYPETQPGREAQTMSFETFVTGFTARGMDSFAANGPRILVDTTDFSKVDFGEIAGHIKELTETLR